MVSSSRMLLLLLLLGACGDTGSERLVVPISAHGTPARDVAVRGGTLRLERADVAFGPLYLCATESAETELCEAALAELLSVHTFDALSSQPRQLGELEATTGTVRSGFFDYGISWLLTRQAPHADPGSASGHSARLVFSAEADDGTSLAVTADVDIEPIAPGDAAVNGLRTQHALREGDRLTVSLDASAWLSRVRVDRLRELDEDGDGRVTLAPGSQPYEAIVQGMTVNAPVRFGWTR
jgi:hypothetical protein